MPKIRYLGGTAGTASENMAIDETLAARITAADPPILRLYSFKPGALSVGRFQQSTNVIAFKALQADGYDFVRRPTGGKAVLHINDLTYAFILHRSHFHPFKKREIYEFIALMLTAVLKSMGIDVLINKNRTADNSHPDCFQAAGEYEIITPWGGKILGSAQVVSRNSALQHGSLYLEKACSLNRYLIGDFPQSGGFTSLDQETKRKWDFKELSELICREIGHFFTLVPSALRRDEQAESLRLAAEKYENKSWLAMY